MDKESTHQKAQKNLKEWSEAYGTLKHILQNCTDQEFEECVQIAIQRGNVRNESKLRWEFLSIRNETVE